MQSEWKKNLHNGWNPIVVVLINAEWILEINKEQMVGVLRETGTAHDRKAFTVFSGYYDCEDRFEQTWVDVIEEVFINPDGMCEGKISMRDKSGRIKNYRFLVDLKNGQRKIERN